MPLVVNHKRILVCVLSSMVCVLPMLAWQSGVDNPSAASAVPVADNVLAATHRTVIFDGSPFSPGMLVAKWSGSYLISFSAVDTSGPKSDGVRLYDANGIETREATVWFAGAGLVSVLNGAVTQDGKIVVAGKTVKTDGARTGFIEWIGQTGTDFNVVYTEGFLPRRVCAAPDGTVWSFGSVSDPSEAVLRHYHPVKGQIAALVPRSSFPGRYSPPEVRVNGGPDFVGCSSERVAVYSEVSDEYFEIEYATEKVGRWAIDRSASDIRLYGFAVVQSGEVYAISDRAVDAPGHRQLFQLQVDRPAGKVRWLRVEGEKDNELEPSRIGTLLGAEGDSIVYLKVEDWPTVHWARPVSRGTSEVAKR